MKKINKKTLMYFLLAYISGCFYAFGFLRLNSNFNKSLEGLLLGSLFPGGFVGLGLVAIFLVFVLGTIITKVEKVIYGIKNEFDEVSEINKEHSNNIISHFIYELEEYYEKFILYMVIVVSITVFISFLVLSN